MSKLVSRYHGPAMGGLTQSITPESAGWGYVGFRVYELKAGSKLACSSGDNEICLVLVSGRADVKTKDCEWANIGDRMNPFERKKPYAVYLPNDDGFAVHAVTDLELAVCEAPGKGNHKARLIGPEDIDAEARGKGFNRRFVHNILPDDKPADSLLVVEVYTDESNTSSYPSHKHDEDRPPEETYLEETYYHRINPPQGFAFQRVYTDDRELDESMTVHNKDVTMVPKGYHPVATVAGYDNYYLNVMAGPVRKWCFTWDRDHSWINGPDYPKEI